MASNYMNDTHTNFFKQSNYSIKDKKSTSYDKNRAKLSTRAGGLSNWPKINESPSDFGNSVQKFSVRSSFNGDPVILINFYNRKNYKKN